MWAGMTVPTPFVEYLPRDPQPIAPLILVDGAELAAGVDTKLLTIVVRQQPSLPALSAWLDDQRRLLPAARVLPQDIDRFEYQQRQRDRFSRQFEVAAAVGAQTAGIDAELVSEVVIVDIVDGSAADGRLIRGDVVVAVDGVSVTAAEELHHAVVNRAIGDELVVTIAREGRRSDVPIVLGAIPGVEGPRIGVTVQTAVDVVRLPFDIALANDVRIGGPSAGLMIGLTVYAALSGDRRFDGLAIAGTGSLDANGAVGTVGGVPEKVRAAIRDGADIVFVPAHQVDEARHVDGVDSVRLIGVSSLTEAIEALGPPLVTG